MRMTKYAMAAALAAITWGHGAFGQQPVQNVAPVTRPVSYDYYSTPSGEQQTVGYSMASSSTLMGGEAACGAAPTCSTGCNTSCGNGSCDDGCSSLLCWPCGCKLSDLGDPKKFFDGCYVKENNINAGGWLAQSYVWNPYQPHDRFNGPMTWTDRANDYQMNELYFFFRKQTKTDGCGMDWGYGIDTLYGTSYRWNTSAQFETDWGNGSFYGLAVPQLYAELAINDWTIKAGRFFSPVGFYAVGTNNNFFPVLPYTFQYGEPFTHTGAYAVKKQSDQLTWGGGVVRGWDNSGNDNPNLSAIATATITRDNGDTLGYFGVYGRDFNAQGGLSTRYMQSLVYTKKFSDDIIGVLQSDYGIQGDSLGPNQSARWYGLNSYLYWNMTCQTQWGLNGEWFRDEGGTRVGAAVPSLGSPNARGYTGAGFDGSFYRMMFGPKHYFTPNLYTRVAVAFDWYDGKDSRINGQRPFDDGTKNYQQVGVFDLVWTF